MASPTVDAVVVDHGVLANDELYFALRARKVDSALVRLGDASQPGRMILEMESTLAWIGR